MELKTIITRKNNNTPLNNIWLGEFCSGVKCIQFSNRCWTIFNNTDDAKKYIETALHSLDVWIEIDIPIQSKKWRIEDINGFLENSKKNYLKIKKAINNLVIMDVKF